MTKSQIHYLRIAVIVALIFGAYFLRHYFTLVALAAILAFMYNPTYHWFLKKTNKNTNLAVTLTLFFAFFTIFIPVVIILGLTFRQALEFVNHIKQSNVNSVSLRLMVNNLTSPLNHAIHHVPSEGNVNISYDSIVSWLSSNLSSVAKNGFKYVISFAGGIGTFITKIVIFIFVFISLLRNQKKIVETLKQLNPLGDEASSLYFSRIKAMTHAMVRGQFIIAFLQGVVDASLFWLVGIDFFFFWLVLITFLSIIPLGGGIIVLPVGVVMLLTGHIWQGLTLIIGHLVIVTNLDNVLRPRLVPKSARLDAALLIISVFAGIAMFGFLGIVIGPVIMIAIVTTLQVYLEFHNNNLVSEQKVASIKTK